MDPAAVANAARNCAAHPNIKIQKTSLHDFAVRDENRRRYDFVDLDPFGSIAYHVDDAIDMVSDDGYLAVASFDVSDLRDGHKYSRRNTFPHETTPCIDEISLRMLISYVGDQFHSCGRSGALVYSSFSSGFACVLSLSGFVANCDKGSSIIMSPPICIDISHFH